MKITKYKNLWGGLIKAQPDFWDRDVNPIWFYLIFIGTLVAAAFILII